MRRPYTEIRENGVIRRTFLGTVINEELVWHRDRKDRYVTIIESDGWQLQIDNELPQILEVGKTYFIQAEVYHRIIKGKNNLVLQIREV